MLTPKVANLYTSLLNKYRKIQRGLPISFTEEENSMDRMLTQEGIFDYEQKAIHLMQLLESSTISNNKPTEKYEAARLLTYSFIREASSTHSLYAILLRLYATPEYKELGEEAWLMNAHIGRACVNYVEANRTEIINFLKGESA